VDYTVDFDAELATGVGERVDVAEGIEHPYFIFLVCVVGHGVGNFVVMSIKFQILSSHTILVSRLL
jgi:hypothetical protein